jgi:transglutaminase-like putative cysteine protease
MPVFKIQHLTRYEYDRPVRESANQIKIYPLQRTGQTTSSHIVRISNDPLVHLFYDFRGNATGWFMVNSLHDFLEIESRLIVQTSPENLQWLHQSNVQEWAAFKTTLQTDIQLLDLMLPENMVQKETLKNIVDDLRPHWDAPAMFIQRCSEYIYEHFEYQKGITNVETTLDEVLEYKKGVCQDFAHLLLQMLRISGIPARYVSGYICPNRDGVRGAGATHAWVEVWLPSAGKWTGIDPTNNIWVNDQHVALATGRHFTDCTPVKGVFKGPANQTLSVYVSVGFEDGSVFEDRNKVQLQREEPIQPRMDFDGGAQQ